MKFNPLIPEVSVTDIEKTIEFVKCKKLKSNTLQCM